MIALTIAATVTSKSPIFRRGDVDYFFYCRDRPGTWEVRSELTEDHWAFMDRYADTMIARGPTFTPDGTAVTGSMHIVGLPDPAAAHEFAFEEPNYKAGVQPLDEAHHQYLERGYREHLIAYGPLLSLDGTGRTGTALEPVSDTSRPFCCGRHS
jgi:uncharacterized protein YciI